MGETKMAPGLLFGEFTMLEHRSVGILYFLSGLLGVTSNLILVLIFLRDKTLSGGRNKVFIQLAIANLMVVVGTPFSGSSAFAGRWLWGDTGCRLYGAETYIGGMGVVTFSFLACVQRYFALSDAGQSGSSNTLCILGWLFSITIALMPLFGWNTFEVESSGTACGLNYLSDDTSYHAYFWILNVVMGVIIVLGLLALRAAFSAPANSQLIGDDWFSENQLNWIAAANFAIATIGFAPYGYLGIWALVSDKTRMTMLASVIPPVAAKLSACLYAIVYCSASKKFRDAFYRSIFGTRDAPSKKGE